MLRKVEHVSKNNYVKQTGVFSEFFYSEQNSNSNNIQLNYDKFVHVKAFFTC